MLRYDSPTYCNNHRFYQTHDKKEHGVHICHKASMKIDELQQLEQSVLLPQHLQVLNNVLVSVSSHISPLSYYYNRQAFRNNRNCQGSNL